MTDFFVLYLLAGLVLGIPGTTAFFRCLEVNIQTDLEPKDDTATFVVFVLAALLWPVPIVLWFLRRFLSGVPRVGGGFVRRAVTHFDQWYIVMRDRMQRRKEDK